MVVTLSNFAPTGKLTMSTVIDCLLNEEARRKERGISMQSEANFVNNCGKRENYEEIRDVIRLGGDINLALN